MAVIINDWNFMNLKPNLNKQLKNHKYYIERFHYQTVVDTFIRRMLHTKNTDVQFDDNLKTKAIQKPALNFEICRRKIVLGRFSRDNERRMEEIYLEIVPWIG